ncbi:MAG: hypothetical protein ACTS73_08815 [Arsenophonus sp. NEOnobi-MAG3]
MAYHLYDVEIIHEINQQDTPLSSKRHTAEMRITQSPAITGEDLRILLEVL